MEGKYWLTIVSIIVILIASFLVLPSIMQFTWLEKYIEVELYTNNVSFSTFISILLTVVTVILAALALFIGVFAFVTIDRVKTEVRNIAEEEAKRQVKKLIADSTEELLVELNKKISSYATYTTKEEFNKIFTEEATQNELISLIRNIIKQEIISKSIEDQQKE